MSKKSYIDIKETSASKTFNKRTNLLGLDIDKQCEMLNKMYEGNIEFYITKENEFSSSRPVIAIKDISDNIRILELPECEHLNLEATGFFKFHSSVGSIRLPKCMKEIEIRKLKWYFPNLKTIFAWSNQELFLNQIKNHIGYDYVIIQNENGGKSTILRNI